MIGQEAQSDGHGSNSRQSFSCSCVLRIERKPAMGALALGATTTEAARMTDARGSPMRLVPARRRPGGAPIPRCCR